MTTKDIQPVAPDAGADNDAKADDDTDARAKDRKAERKAMGFRRP